MGYSLPRTIASIKNKSCRIYGQKEYLLGYGMNTLFTDASINNNLDIIVTSNAVEMTVAAPAELTLEQKIERAIDTVMDLLGQGKNISCSSSFGKDSSVLLNIFLTALRRYVETHGSAPQCMVINSNTLVENPVMDAYSRAEANKVEAFAAAHNLPLRMDIVSPNLSNNYLVNILGGRLILVDALNDSKCTSMMKITPINSHKNKVFKEFGKSNVVTLIGKRADESAARARNMKENGESPSAIVSGAKGEQVLSLIADFTLEDIFFYIGKVRGEKIECYSDFDALVEIYRDANGGDCMVNIYSSGQGDKSNTACGSRMGCYLCARIANDKSLENMLVEEKFSYMAPLNDLRSYMIANHYDPSKRNWISRTVQADGTVKIAPNAYSPQYAEELLRLVLSIDANEAEAAHRLGIEPRFQLLRLEDLVGIEMLWSRYAYHAAGRAIQIWDEIYRKNKNFPIPAIKKTFVRKNLKLTSVSVPFADEHYGAIFSGLRNIGAAVADCESTVTKESGTYTNARTENEFTVDVEGAELFFAFEVDNYINKFSEPGYNPTHVYHYFLGLGTVSLNKGGHSENDRMLRMANQIHRHGLVDILNDPVALIAKLGGSNLEDTETSDVVLDIMNAAPQLDLFATA